MPHVKAYQREYGQRPEVKARQAARRQARTRANATDPPAPNASATEEATAATL